jgi:hypothetical protein
MKIQQLASGEIQITFRPDEIANFQTVLPLEEIEPVKRFEDCLHKVQYKTRDFLKELRDHYGIKNEIKRNDKKVNDLRFKYQVSNLSKTLQFHEKSGLITIKKANDLNDNSSKIINFKFNF